MTFIEGTKWFRSIVKSPSSHFVKGVTFAGGTKFPFVRGTVNKKVEKDTLNFMYAVTKNED